MDRLVQDVRYALRRMANSPVFTSVAVLSLAIGIGANTAIFSAVNAVFLREYPFEDADEIVRVYSGAEGRSASSSLSFPAFQDVRSAGDVFEAVGASDVFLAQAELGGEGRLVMGEAISHDLFPMLGVTPALGRWFFPEEDRTPGAHPVLMLGYSFWQDAFGGDPEVVGRSLRVAGTPYEIVGVAPEWFHSFLASSLKSDLFVPLMMAGAVTGNEPSSYFDDRNSRRFVVMARLADGVSLESAEAGLGVLTDQLAAAYPDQESGRYLSAVPFESITIQPGIDQTLKGIAVFLMVVVGMVLLLACTNLASFLLARGTERKKEIALRLALGARRGALVRQLLVETVLLALLGGAAGILVAHWTLGLIMGFHPPIPITFTLDYPLDRTVLLFALGISLVAGVAFGLAPALQSTRPDLAPTLKNESGTGRHRRFSLRNGLIVFQMAVSMVLLVGGGLFVRSLGVARSVDPGFSTRDAGIVWIDLSRSGLSRSAYRDLREELTARARAMPGIESVTVSGRIPLFLSSSSARYEISGLEPPSGQSGHSVQHGEVDPGYFQTLGIPILEGRGIGEEDRAGSPWVAVVNQTAARRFWPGESPIGKEVRNPGIDRTYRVVGVSGDTKMESLGEPPTPLFLFSIDQQEHSEVLLVARGAQSPAEIVGMLHRMVREVDPSLVVMEAYTMEEHIGVMLFAPRLAATLLGFFGVVALVLATIGLYGIVSFSVSRRTREVGIRMSLGADRAAVMGMVVRGAMGLVAVGGTVGFLIAVALSRLIRQFLFGIGPADPLTLLGVPLLLAGVAALAAYIPGRRASRVNPVEALRRD